MKTKYPKAEAIRGFLYQCILCEKKCNEVYDFHCWSCESQMRKSKESLRHSDKIK